jgi:hypothetical protein
MREERKPSHQCEQQNTGSLNTGRAGSRPGERHRQTYRQKEEKRDDPPLRFFVNRLEFADGSAEYQEAGGRQ